MRTRSRKPFTGDTGSCRRKRCKDHYHRIELDITPDETSHCIKCHGDLPHGKSEHIRAFLNMHNLYFACQTCHVRPTDSGRKIALLLV